MDWPDFLAFAGAFNSIESKYDLNDNGRHDRAEPFVDGQPFRYDIVWVLKQETSGWRVSGLSTRLLEGGNPVLFNFEDPAEMERNSLAARQELTERMQRTRQANQPQVPNGTQRR